MKLDEKQNKQGEDISGRDILGTHSREHYNYVHGYAAVIIKNAVCAILKMLANTEIRLYWLFFLNLVWPRIYRFMFYL